MSEWAPAEVHVRVPDDFDIDPWLTAAADRYGYDRTALATPDTGTEALVPAPIDALAATATTGEFEWEWDPDARLLSVTDLEVNYGLDDWFTDLATALRTAGCAYHFESDGKYEWPGQCWEWAPGWPDEHRLIQAGDRKTLDLHDIQVGFDEARRLGVDPTDYFARLLAPWPDWIPPTPPDQPTDAPGADEA